MRSIRIAIFDDSADIRDGLKGILKFYPDMQVLGAFQNANDIAGFVSLEKPDVILMDITMPGMNGIEATAVVKSFSPQTQVIILSQHSDDEKVFTALRFGATGYLLKGEDAGSIVEAIRTVVAGGSPMNAFVARKAVDYFQKQPVQSSRTNETADFGLSAREMDVLKCLGKGMTYKEIAADLNISIDTVRSHIRHIYEKLQARSKSEAILIAMRKGLI
ncbi:MAG: response regulator transcription factor [Saprospiraceae bacterium]|nr:response regulator transcription factor [Saprospiraceae bacterium]